MYLLPNYMQALVLKQQSIKVVKLLASVPLVMHESFETPAPPPPHSGLSGGLEGLSPQIHSMLVPR